MGFIRCCAVPPYRAASEVALERRVAAAKARELTRACPVIGRLRLAAALKEKTDITVCGGPETTPFLEAKSLQEVRLRARVIHVSERQETENEKKAERKHTKKNETAI